MHCSSCGQQTIDGARFCSNCGQRLVSDWSAPRRLYRLPAEKKIAGVCAGFAEYLNLDVTLVRIIVLALTCVTGFLPGFVAYILTWIIMPTPPMALTGATAAHTPVHP